MRLDQIASLAVEHFLGRLLRRAAAFALLGLLALFALYHFTVAGTIALEDELGMLYARLIIAAVYAIGALATLGWLYATRARRLVLPRGKGALAGSRNMQIAMLVEAVTLGYALARKKTR